MNQPLILDRLVALSDQVRCRIMCLLERQELMVGEICSVLQLPQSTVSRHLKVLVDSGWLVARRHGTRHFYTLAPGGETDRTSALWGVVREEMSPSREAAGDQRRLQRVLAERRTKSEEFFASAAGQWDQVRSDLFGSRFSDLALLALLDPQWTVGDLGCGTGQAAAALAPFVKRVIAVDGSKEMLRAARRRLSALENVELRPSGLEDLPLKGAELDAAVCMLVLHHVPDPVAILREAARVVRPGGRFLVVDMYRHDREEYRQQMGHVWLGFSEEQMRDHLEQAGFEALRFFRLPPEPDAKGPELFAVSARRARQEVLKYIPKPQASRRGKAGGAGGESGSPSNRSSTQKRRRDNDNDSQ